MIYFVSDLHINHKNIISYCSRPFISLKEMHETLISNWNSVVTTDDLVYVIGDFCFGNVGTLNHFTKHLSRKQLYLVRGNHDTHSNKKYYDAGFDSVVEEEFIFLDDWIFRLNHFPYTDFINLEFPRKYHSLYPEPQKENILICGHMHSKPVNKIKTVFRGDRKYKLYDVGVDANHFTPVSLTQIIEKINKET